MTTKSHLGTLTVRGEQATKAAHVDCFQCCIRNILHSCIVVEEYMDKHAVERVTTTGVDKYLYSCTILYQGIAYFLSGTGFNSICQ
jgi:hypothetical protein